MARWKKASSDGTLTVISGELADMRTAVRTLTRLTNTAVRRSSNGKFFSLMRRALCSLITYWFHEGIARNLDWKAISRSRRGSSRTESHMSLKMAVIMGSISLFSFLT